MLHLGIDLHQYQITIALMNDDGEIIRRGKVRTKPPAIDRFLAEVRSQAETCGGYRAIVEECGFTHWLIEKLRVHECDMIVLVQPLKRAAHKTDRRDAAKLAETLWVNRERLRAGVRIHGIRQVVIPSEEDRQARLLTNDRNTLVGHRTQQINRIKACLRRFNLMHECPTKGFQTKRARAWLRALELPDADQLLLALALAHWELLDEQIAKLDAAIERHAGEHSAAQVLQTIPGVAELTGLAIASRIGSIERFPRPGSLANMFGLTPTINDSGETVGRRGSITKRGHPIVRYLLGQVVHHVNRADPRMRSIYRKLRKRRGAKTALVAMMRRIICTIWHMLQTGEVWRPSEPVGT